MTYRNPVQFAVISAGQTVQSEPFDVRGVREVALRAPSSIGVAMFVQGSWDTASANFTRIQKPGIETGSGDYTIPAPAGNKPVAVNLAALVRPFPYVRVEMASAPPSDVRTFTLMAR